MSKESSIKCPNCSELIELNEILYNQLKSKFKQKNLNKKKKFKEEIVWNTIWNIKVLELSHGEIDAIS